MKGWRTLLLNGAVVVGTATAAWAAGINWSEYVSPTWAMVILALANVGMRMITTGPVGAK